MFLVLKPRLWRTAPSESRDVDPVSQQQVHNKTVVSRTEFFASYLGFWSIVLAQMSNTDSDSEQTYNLDHSEFNYISG